MTTYNWRSVWAPRTRGGFEVVDVRESGRDHLACAIWEDDQYRHRTVYSNGRYFRDEEYQCDLIPLDPAQVEAVVINHQEAAEYAKLHPESNLARCYLDLRTPQAVGDEVDPLLVEARRIRDIWPNGPLTEIEDFAKAVIARLESGEQPTSCQLLECPQCGKRGVQYDPLCKSFVCLMENCNAAWSLHVRQEVESGEQGCEQQRLLDGYKAEYERLTGEVSRLRVDIASLWAATKGDFWLHQDDGDNYPESLTCRVVMTAEQYRGLMAHQPAEVAPTPKFKVGDRVRGNCIGEMGFDFFRSEAAINNGLEVKAMRHESAWGWALSFDGDMGFWNEDSFELVAPSDQETVTDQVVDANKTVPLNNDVSPETSRALHRVVRAIHDGNCPACGVIQDSERTRTATGWKCPECDFEVSNEEAADALELFRPFMKANLDQFEAWRLQRKGQ